jgi:hypothetical protein
MSDPIDNAVNSAADSIEGATGKVNKFLTSAEKLAIQIGDLSKSLQNFAASGTAAGQTFEQLTPGGASAAFENFTKVIEESEEAWKGLTGTLMSAGLGNLGLGIGGAIRSVQAFSTTAASMGKTLHEVGRAGFEAFDGLSRPIRRMDAQMFTLAKRFGGTIEESRKFADALKMESATDFARSMHLSTRETIAFYEATKQTSLTQEQLSESIDTGIGKVSLLTAATALASATGMQATEAAQLLNTAMNRQGKTAQEAANMIGMFHDVASQTGLGIDTVAKSLNGAITNFQKLGMAADFGRPILEGFGRVMDDLGLGIEEGADLAGKLTGALAGLADNYANAYIVFQKGGLDMGGGGGGVLGASISMQAALREGGDQAQMGQMLAEGLRDTLQSFSGGGIVTVDQANQSPELQNQFYIQQQLLKSQFGISDNASATTILDLLANLDEATRTGDKDGQRALEESLQKEMAGRDKTMDEWEKANRNLEIQTNLLAVVARDKLEGPQFRELAASLGRTVGKKTDEASKSVFALLGLEHPDSAAGQRTRGTASRMTAQPRVRSGATSASRVIDRGMGYGALGVVDDEGMSQALSEVMNLGKGGREVSMDQEINRAVANLSGKKTDAQLETSGMTRGEYEAQLWRTIKDAIEGQNKIIEIKFTGAGERYFEAGEQMRSEASRLSKGVG